MTSIIYRALHLFVERDKGRTANITNLNVSVLPGTGFLDSTFNHSPLRFTFVTPAGRIQDAIGFLSNWNDKLIVQRFPTLLGARRTWK